MDNLEVELLFSILIVPALGLLKHIPICDERRNLTPQQVSLCKKYESYHVATIIDAKFISNTECAKQFEGQRWNCSLPTKGMLALFRPNVPEGKASLNRIIQWTLSLSRIETPVLLILAKFS